jgi:hypothetical protein
MMYFRQRVLLQQAKYVGVDIILFTWKFIQEYFAGNQTFLFIAAICQSSKWFVLMACNDVYILGPYQY